MYAGILHLRIGARKIACGNRNAIMAAWQPAFDVILASDDRGQGKDSRCARCEAWLNRRKAAKAA